MSWILINPCNLLFQSFCRCKLNCLRRRYLKTTAENAVYALENKLRYLDAAAFAKKSIAALNEAGVVISSSLLRVACERCQQIGDMENARSFIVRAIEAFNSAKKQGKAIEESDFAHALLTHGCLLVQDGSIEEARKLYQEASDIFESLGAQRSRAVTLGDIARIKVSKGEVEEALKLHQERLGVFESLEDPSSKAQTLWSLAQIELQRESYQKAFEHLSESYMLNLKIGRLDGICVLGMDLGTLLCQAGEKKQGLEVLNRSRDGFKKLGQESLVIRVQELINKFED